MNVLALDVGGAHIKVAHSNGATVCQPFALWQEPQSLSDVLNTIAQHANSFDHLALTMTGELCDCFATKRDGVHCVLNAVEAVADGRPICVWQTDGRFVLPAEAREHPMRCAAANWHALGTLLAHWSNGDNLLAIDIGSTTTDLISIHDSQIRAKGLTDTERLTTGELLYLGTQRTPLMALGPTVTWRSRTHLVMAEAFACTHDVFVLTGNLPPDPKYVETCDGRPMTYRAAAARVVRMIGADLDSLSINDAVQLAQAFADVARARVSEAFVRCAARRKVTRVIISGSGAFLAEAAMAAVLPSTSIYRLADRIGADASVAACAHALVYLLPMHWP